MIVSLRSLTNRGRSKLALSLPRPPSSLRVALFALAVSIGIAPLTGALQTRKLQLASTVWPPFTNQAGQARFATDLVSEALGRIGITAETAIVADGALTPALLTGKFDGSAALWRDEERERRLLYSQLYLQNRLVLVGRKGSDVSAATLAQIIGKRIALVEGFAYGDVLAKMPKSTFVPSHSLEQSLQRVLSSEADYTLLDELVVQYLLRAFPKETSNRLALGSVPLVIRSLHFAVRRDLPDAASIVERFDAELPRMVADRSYHRLLQVPWIEADVDGDGKVESVAASDQGGLKPPNRQYQLVSSTIGPTKPASQQRFYFGGEVWEGWSSVPERFKVGDPSKTPWGATVSPIFSFKW
jgi:ABC-type amino acid transport substrate-binding protein